ncbi:S-adenosyl-L-methionine-dependent methyltransferase [Polychytrium aggregatum]|uniref:S-adenosyl-L-methionine-dependent methyltransferase n=1 Tax=Polychytrium aggregatum TaxID=110093 RepID=UPI0022FF3041|nr:S-adenosyl-L-methionine-dependent methyltransferase [Polychytrium aggregatum]KAI9203981.1 S-adenosyl-L-methionine-dependent methyltransferase [Polychytrium aggregatum]
MSSPEASLEPAQSSDKKKVSSLSSFGTRQLQNEADVFSHNAWDNFQWGDEQEKDALEIIQKQQEKPVSDEDKDIYHRDPDRFWSLFYSKNQNKFFKDRHWLRIEFPELFAKLPKDNLMPFRVFEIGCGAGNTVFPLLNEARDANVFVYAGDFAWTAIDVVKSNPEYNEDKCKAFVYDITAPDIPEYIEPESLDVCICIFVLSAVHPDTWARAVDNIYKMLKPGGLVLLRDYARYDLAQLRFKGGRFLDENFYVRGDGTRVYFFTQDEIANMFSKFHIDQNALDRRLIVNRHKKLKMYRIWIQGKFRKPLPGEAPRVSAEASIPTARPEGAEADEME